MASKEQLIGNAVPVKLAEYVAKILGNHIATEKREHKIDYNGQIKLNI